MITYVGFKNGWNGKYDGNDRFLTLQIKNGTRKNALFLSAYMMSFDRQLPHDERLTIYNS
jgi:hypothetical protein